MALCHGTLEYFLHCIFLDLDDFTCTSTAFFVKVKCPTWRPVPRKVYAVRWRELALHLPRIELTCVVHDPSVTDAA